MTDAAKILVVDDTANNVKLLKDLLTMKGYAVVTASSGAEGLEQVDKERPDLVLFEGSGAAEGWLASDQFVKDGAEAVNIGGGGELLAAATSLLRRHVVGSAKRGSAVGQAAEV